MAEPLWTSDEIISAVGGRLWGKPFAATGVSIDTRTLQPGDLFVALAGARDGHAFVAQARAAGAAGALVAKPSLGGEIVVPDTLKALEALGLAARDRSGARRAAVTGSVGKTSATRAIAAGLALAGPSHASVKSYNNHIGVPLTLARMPRGAQRAVFEVGMNHAGEIGPLAKMITPHVVLITTVGPVHIENFADGEAGVARAKAEIFEGLTAGATAVLNADDRWFALLEDAAGRAGARIVTFGSTPGLDAQLLAFEPTGQAGEGALVRARIHGRDVSVTLRQTGVHWGLNSLGVLLTLEALGVELNTGLAALAAFAPIEGRGAQTTVRTKGGAFTLVDESYNANPMSMAAALASLGARATQGRRIVALTDMLELGGEGPRYHAGLAQPIEAAGVDLVFCAGPLMKSLWEALPATRRGGYAETAAALAPQVVLAVEPGDLVMVKGSNGSNAGAVAAALAAMSDAPKVEGGRT